MLFIFKWIFNNIFGLSSLIISLYTLWKNRKHLDVYWDDNILRTKPHSIVAIHNGEPGFYENSYLTRLSVINTSPNDIAFFDLRAFNPNTNINFPLVTKKTFEYGKENTEVFHIINGRHTRLNIPEKNSGVFKANSFTQFDLIICIPENLKEKENINISFKIATHNHLSYRDPFSITRRKFKWFGKSYSSAFDKSNQRHDKS